MATSIFYGKRHCISSNSLNPGVQRLLAYQAQAPCQGGAWATSSGIDPCHSQVILLVAPGSWQIDWSLAALQHRSPKTQYCNRIGASKHLRDTNGHLVQYTAVPTCHLRLVLDSLCHSDTPNGKSVSARCWQAPSFMGLQDSGTGSQ